MFDYQAKSWGGEPLRYGYVHASLNGDLWRDDLNVRKVFWVWGRKLLIDKAWDLYIRLGRGKLVLVVECNARFSSHIDCFLRIEWLW
jgi:hypothetical protein